jgi:hypothetical protein
LEYLEQVSCVHLRVLDVHDPMPGMIFNADWKMLHLNARASWVFRLVMPEFLETVPKNSGGWNMVESEVRGRPLRCQYDKSETRS